MYNTLLIFTALSSDLQEKMELELEDLSLRNNSNIVKRAAPVDVDGSNGATESLNISSFPPVDSGFHAWAYLGSAWVLDCFLWGLPFSYGVFLKYYSVSSPTMKHSSLTLLTLVGTLNTGILYISSLLLLPVMNHYPHQKKTVMIIGYVLSISGLIGAAYARNAGELILTQGILFGLGGSLLYFPMMTWLFEWFSAKRGLANGILFSGASAGGVVGPFVIEALLARYGQKVTLLAIAIFLTIFIAPCFLFLKPRLPVARALSSPQLKFRFLHSRVFWILFASNIIQGLGNFIPYLYLPTFALSLNLKSTDGTLGVALLNAASIVGMIFIGWLSDRNLRASMALSSAGSALAVFLLWGLSPSLASYAVFATAYGFLGPSWAALYPRFASAAAEDDPRLSSVLLSIFLAGRGLGNVLSAPISTSLNHPWVLTDKTSLNYGLDGYGPLIIFTGTTLLVSSLGAAY